MSQRGMYLRDLLPPDLALTPVPDQLITGISLDSRQVQPGDLFLALAGARGHGLQWASQALDRGCAAIAYEPAPEMPPVPEPSAPMLGCRDLGRQASAIADRFFGQPSAALQVIGVTGTNGKSTVVELLAGALHGAGAPTGTLGTLGSGMVGARHQASPLTTPDPITVQRELARMRDAGARFVVMEVSSHALAQQRLAGVRICGAVFTNLSRDHLDYHGSMAAYADAKARLFTDFGLKFAIVNGDDDYGQKMADAVGAQPLLVTFGFNKADVQATELAYLDQGVRYRLSLHDESVVVSSRLLGRFNVSNQLGVAASLYALGWTATDIVRSLQQLVPPPGRMQCLGGGDKALVVIDYAHTPDALASALTSVRQHSPGRLVCVFGCGGDRDRGKRPMMGTVAEQLSDEIVLTDDNPRTEDPGAIITDILGGIGPKATVTVIRDRARAISHAVGNAHRGDSVLIAGKGHEDYQETQGQRRPFDDCQHAAAALEVAA